MCVLDFTNSRGFGQHGTHATQYYCHHHRHHHHHQHCICARECLCVCVFTEMNILFYLKKKLCQMHGKVSRSPCMPNGKYETFFKTHAQTDGQSLCRIDKICSQRNARAVSASANVSVCASKQRIE